VSAELPDALIRDIVARALAEDTGPGDLTTRATVDAGRTARGEVIAKEDGVIAGLGVAVATFRAVDPGLRFLAFVSDGERVGPGKAVARVAGSAQAILTAERTALNFLQRMSGVATLTSRYVAAVAATGTQIVDTRKTAPGLRALDKYAVRMGGGRNHRFGLYDGVLIKDNHIAAAGGITKAITLARRAIPHLVKIEVEVTNQAELEQALAAQAEVVMLDNMTPKEAAAAVRFIAGRALVEISGNVTLHNIEDYVECGADFISVGALTHSAPALDLSLEIHTG
jgi:nicotinate-nucleotide pyrophosphorylase (carboxylating)